MNCETDGGAGEGRDGARECEGVDGEGLAGEALSPSSMLDNEEVDDDLDLGSVILCVERA